MLGSNVRAKWVRGITNIADVFTRMWKVVPKEVLKEAFKQLFLIYKQSFQYYDGDLNKCQKALADHRSLEVGRCKKRDNVPEDDQSEDMRYFHHEEIWYHTDSKTRSLGESRIQWFN